MWALDTSRKALLDAGIALDADVLERTGVIMGALSFPTTRSNDLFLPIYHSAVEKALQEKLANPQFSLLPSNDQVQPLNTANGVAAHNASKIVADALGLGSTQLSLDAACASSVYSLKLACDYLSTGKADMMLAGAVSGADPFFINMGFSIFHAYPDHGVSVPFDSNSKGLFAGEGAGVLVLKRLEDAERDGDHIYAVVSGIGLSNDGRGQFVLSPNSKGQVQAFERAYEASDLSPESIEVIECHATGTPLGDKVELTSMERFFADKLNGSQVPLIGSAKSNLGHLLTAAGMPGIMKMIFAMKEACYPQVLICQNLCHHLKVYLALKHCRLKYSLGQIKQAILNVVLAYQYLVLVAVMLTCYLNLIQAHIQQQKLRLKRQFVKLIRYHVTPQH